MQAHIELIISRLFARFSTSNPNASKQRRFINF